MTYAERPYQLAPWMADALCKGAVSDLFFPQRGDSPAPAKKICSKCPVKAECLEWALDNHEVGVWGATTQRERRLIRRRPVRVAATNCGTEAGYQSHRYNGEEICDPCKVARNAAVTRRRGAA